MILLAIPSCASAPYPFNHREVFRIKKSKQSRRPSNRFNILHPPQQSPNHRHPLFSIRLWVYSALLAAAPRCTLISGLNLMIPIHSIGVSRWWYSCIRTTSLSSSRSIVTPRSIRLLMYRRCHRRSGSIPLISCDAPARVRVRSYSSLRSIWALHDNVRYPCGLRVLREKEIIGIRVFRNDVPRMKKTWNVA